MLLALAGCSSIPNPLRGPTALQRASVQSGCPPHEIKRMIQLRTNLKSIQPGVTPAGATRSLGKPLRTVVLARQGQRDLLVAFYPMGMASCPWLADSAPFMPVVMEQGRKGVVLGYGNETLQTLHAQGWELGYRHTRRGGLFGKDSQTFTATPWPWQSYGYSYLPKR